MEVRLVWVIGPTCVGKTHYVKERTKYTGRAVHTGEWLRQQVGSYKMSQSSNSSAPEEVEGAVREYVAERIRDLIRQAIPDQSEGRITIYIDSMPRNAGQVAWVTEFSGFKLKLLSYPIKREGGELVRVILSSRVELLTCFHDIRDRRIEERVKGGTTADQELLIKRVKGDEGQLYGALVALIRCGISVLVVDTNQHVEL